jgi:hypothetical protein
MNTIAKTPSEIWEEIKGKSHLYETAYLVSNGEPVKILGLRCPGTFLVRMLDGATADYGCHELKNYCL